MKNRAAEFIKSVLAGIMISIGGMVYLSCENKYVGAFFFATGLIGVVMLGLNLYTGKIGYVLDNDKNFLIDTILSVFGNLLGCFLCGYAKSPISNVVEICAKKFEKTIPEVFIDGIFCGILIFVAVEIFKKKNHIVGVLLCVPTFILCGFEHSVADMLYIFNARMMDLEGMIFTATVVLGNAVGGLLFPVSLKLYSYLTKKQ